jgi:hypothetical protein
MRWFSFKEEYEKRYAKLSTAELAEHEAWKKKIDKAMEDAGIECLSNGKDDNDSDSADEEASRHAALERPGETRSRKKNISKAMEDAGNASDSDGKQDNDSDSANDLELQPAKLKQPKRPTRAKYTGDHEIVLHILRNRKDIDHDTLADVFNHIFRNEGVVRNKSALGKHWGRFKDFINNECSNLSPAEQAEYAAWKQKVDDTIEELSG